MEQVNTLDFLLEVEAKASALVKEAAEEADARVRKCEEELRLAYEDRCKKEIQEQEKKLVQHHEKVKNDYKKIMDSYINDLLTINGNNEKFKALINRYLDNNAGDA